MSGDIFFLLWGTGMPLLLASGDAALQKIFFIYLFFCIYLFFFLERET